MISVSMTIPSFKLDWINYLKIRGMEFQLIGVPDVGRCGPDAFGVGPVAHLGQAEASPELT